MVNAGDLKSPGEILAGSIPALGTTYNYEKLMKPELNEKYLITTNDWFFGPDGNQYKAAFGTVNAILTDKDTLGVDTNRHSSNWYVSIGSMIIAGCQIHYAIKTDMVDFSPPDVTLEHEGKFHKDRPVNSSIFDADRFI